MIKLNKIFLLFCLCVCVVVLVFVLCVFVLPFLGADLRRPSGELRYVSAVAVPQSGLCPHALSLYHRPGGHVFPGHCPVFPGWQGEGRETVSDSDIVGVTHHYYLFSLFLFEYLRLAWDVLHWHKVHCLSAAVWRSGKSIGFILSAIQTQRGLTLYLDNAGYIDPVAGFWRVSGTSCPAMPTVVPTP